MTSDQSNSDRLNQVRELADGAERLAGESPASDLADAVTRLARAVRWLAYEADDHEGQLASHERSLRSAYLWYGRQKDESR